MLKDGRQMQYQSRNWNSLTEVDMSQVSEGSEHPACTRKPGYGLTHAKLITVEVNNYFKLKCSLGRGIIS
jgi:hypothetical protein